MNSIRRATLDDMDDVLYLVYEFNAHYHHARLNRELVVEYVKRVLKDGVCFRSERGIILGEVMQDAWRDRSVLKELAWYSTDGKGADLLARFLEEAPGLGVHEVHVCTMHTSTPKAEALLTRHGLYKSEQTFVFSV